MMWLHKEREINKENYDAIQSGKKSMEDFFNSCELCGYGATPMHTYEREGKYYIYYGISDSCD